MSSVSSSPSHHQQHSHQHQYLTKLLLYNRNSVWTWLRWSSLFHFLFHKKLPEFSVNKTMFYTLPFRSAGVDVWDDALRRLKHSLYPVKVIMNCQVDIHSTVWVSTSHDSQMTLAKPPFKSRHNIRNSSPTMYTLGRVLSRQSTHNATPTSWNIWTPFYIKCSTSYSWVPPRLNQT